MSPSIHSNDIHFHDTPKLLLGKGTYLRTADERQLLQIEATAAPEAKKSLFNPHTVISTDCSSEQVIRTPLTDLKYFKMERPL